MVNLIAGRGTYRGNALGRMFSFELNCPIKKMDKERLYSALASGDCGWSVYSSMQKEAGFSRTLEEESKRMNLAIGAYSSERALASRITRSLLMVQPLIEDCIDYEEHVIDDYPGGLKDYNRNHNTDFTEQQVSHNGEARNGDIHGVFAGYSQIELAAAKLYEGINKRVDKECLAALHLD